MSAATDSPLVSLPQPPSRPPLRTSSSRTSLGPGVFSPMSSPKSLQRPAGPSPSSSFARLSGTGASGSNSPGNVLGPSPPSGGLSGAGGDLPRLTRAYESGAERNSRNSPSTPGGSLRRSTTMSCGAREPGGSASLGVTLAAKEGSPSSSGGGPGGPAPSGNESAVSVKRERNALLQEKALLLANKRRMEAAIRSLLDQQAEDGAAWAGDGGTKGTAGGGGGGSGSLMPAVGGSRPPLTRATGSVRNVIAKVLEESSNLDKQIVVKGSAGAAILASGEQRLQRAVLAEGIQADADARVRELTALIAELQTEHEVALSRMEGELKYRNTQASAATSSLQRQLGEAEEEVASVRRQLAAAESRVREYADNNTELRRQVFELNTTLGDRNQALADAKTAMGTDKATLQTVNDMLKAQLREAAADRAAKAARISELERQLVHRETLLAEAQQQLEAARGIQAITHHSGSGGAPPGLMAIGSSRSSSIPGGLSAGLSSSVSLPIGAMSSASHSTAGLGGGGGGGGGTGGGGGNGGGGGGGGNGPRLTPLPPPELKDVWGSLSPVLAAVGARSHLPAAGGHNGCNGLSGPNGFNGLAGNGQAAAPVVPSLVMVNGFSKAGGGGGTGAAGGATSGRGGPGTGAGALTPQAMEAAKSLGLSSAYSEDFSGSEPGDAEECE